MEGYRIIARFYKKKYQDFFIRKLFYFYSKLFYSKSIQNDSIKDTLSYCSNKIKYYKNKGCDITNYGFIDKETVKKNYSDFVNSSYKIKHKGSTAGTSGTPFTFFRDLKCMAAEQYLQNSYFGWRNKYRVIFRGERIFFTEGKLKRIYRRIPFINEMYISAYHISDEGLEDVVEKLAEIKNKCLWAYPSTAYLLAQYCIKHNKQLTFDFVTTSSEMIFDWQIEAIEMAFGCKVMDWYGQAERVAALYRCDYGNYHVVKNYSHVEFINYKDNLYELVGSHYHNRIMPMIRYNTHDLVEIEKERCPCGHEGVNIKVIHGRIGDFLDTGSEKKTATGLYCAFFKDAKRIKGAQICVGEDNKIIIKIEKETGFDESDEELLRNTIKTHLPVEMFSIEFVEHIERNVSGKLNYVVRR
ncbi:MAG: hypothetical protein Q8942_06985 [Bacillota bacterium]|nr:hypothetical protein [Bacillota bacterium]